jgi:hypothetical protein
VSVALGSAAVVAPSRRRPGDRPVENPTWEIDEALGILRPAAV